MLCVWVYQTEMSFWMIQFGFKWQPLFCSCQQNTTNTKHHHQISATAYASTTEIKLYIKIKLFRSIRSSSSVRVLQSMCFFSVGPLFFISFNFHLNRIFIVQLAWLLVLLPSPTFFVVVADDVYWTKIEFSFFISFNKEE